VCSLVYLKSIRDSRAHQSLSQPVKFNLARGLRRQSRTATELTELKHIGIWKADTPTHRHTFTTAREKTPPHNTPGDKDFTFKTLRIKRLVGCPPFFCPAISSSSTVYRDYPHTLLCTLVFSGGCWDLPLGQLVCEFDDASNSFHCGKHTRRTVTT